MTVIARKHSSVKQERLRRFVAKHVEALEPGLRIVEAGLRLGRTVVDLVAADARQTLVLIGVGTVATEKMLIGMLDACIWCLQFPDGLRRLCPEAPIAFTRPPRLVVVAEEVPEAFMELVGCVSFEVECHELAREPNREADTPAAPAEPSANEALAVAAPASGLTPATPLTAIPVDTPAPLAAPVVLEASAVSAVSASAPAMSGDHEAGAAAEPGQVGAEATVAAASAEAADGKAGEGAAEVPAPPLTTGDSPGRPPLPGSTSAAASLFSRNGRRIVGAAGPGLVEHGSPAAGGTLAAGEGAGRPGRGYVFAQAVRPPKPAGAAPAADEGPSGEPRVAGSPTPAPAAAAPETKPEGREARRSAVLDSLNLPSTGVSRQWQEFLARLANAK